VREVGEKIMKSIKIKFDLVIFKLVFIVSVIFNYHENSFNERLLFWIEQAIELNKGKLKTYNVNE